MQIKTWNGNIIVQPDDTPHESLSFDSLGQLQSEIAAVGGLGRLRTLLALAEWLETKPTIEVRPKEADAVLEKDFEVSKSPIAIEKRAVAVDELEVKHG